MFIFKQGEAVGVLEPYCEPRACWDVSVPPIYVVEPLFDDFGLIVTVGDLTDTLQERGVDSRRHLDYPDP